MKWALFLLFFSSASLFAGYDQSIAARLDGWELQIHTAGSGDKGGQITTRVHLTGPDPSQKAGLELPVEAFGTLWHHLQRLPRKLMKSGASEGPKINRIVLTTDKDELITDARALDLLRLWLDTHREAWLSPHSPELQATLRSGFFPPKIYNKG